MNNVNLIGRLTRDPELRHTGSGKPVANFTLAVNNNKETEFINCVVWNRQAENLHAYKHKGDQIAVTGRISVSKYEKDGQKRTKFEVTAYQIEYLSSKNTEHTNDEDIPF